MVNYLGVYFDSKLLFFYHNIASIKIVFQNLGLLKCTRRDFKDVTSLKLLYYY